MLCVNLPSLPEDDGEEKADNNEH